MADKVTNLYNALVKSGYAMEPEDQFRKNITDPKKRKAAYNALVSSGYSMEPYEEFESNIGHGKPKQQATAKSRTTASTPAASQTQPQSTWHPTEQEKIRMSYELNQMVSDSKKRMQGMVDQTHRMTERFTPEGRKKAKAAKFRAQLAGTPTRVMGLTPDVAPSTASAEAAGDNTQQDAPKPVQFTSSPVPYGVVTENGKSVTQWLLPDGRLTTNLIEADQAEFGARRARLQHEFENRMKANGLDVTKPEDVQTQAELDMMSPIYPHVQELWQEAEEKHKADKERNADREWSRYNAMGGGREMRIVTTSMNRHADLVSSFTRFDLQRMMNDTWSRLGTAGQQQLASNCLAMLSRQYPGADPAELRDASYQMARQLSDRAVYNFAVDKNAPKSTLEYFGRTVADMNVINSITKGIARSTAGTSGDLPAYEAAMGAYGQNHRVAQVAGTVVGMAVDPVTWVSGGAGSAAAKGAMWAGGRVLATRLGTSTAVGTRLFGSSLGGRIVGGIAGGAGNFATYETIKEAENQFLHGGHINAETGENEGYSAGELLGATTHGIVLGSATGVLSPLIGNVADKYVKATTSTTGKVGVRSAAFATSTLAEGTIFSVPEWYQNAKLEDGDPRKRDNWDVWTDNMAMMIGFKAQHAIKSAPRVIRELRGNGARHGLSFNERLRQRMDASPSDLDLSKEEREELRNYGYGELADLFRRSNPNEPTAGAKASDGAIDFQRVDAERVASRPEFDGYEAMERLMQDGRVSEAARAKAYYILTGRRLPMSSVVGFTETTTEDGSTIINATNAQGDVIITRTFKKGQEAQMQAEKDRIMRQAELNSVDVGERYTDSQADAKVLEAAIREVSPGADFSTVMHIYRMVKEGKVEVSDSQRALAEFIDEAIERNKGVGDAYRAESIRAELKENYGVDVDEALSKEPSKRNALEKECVEVYIERLFPEEARKRGQDDAGADPTDPDAPIDPTAGLRSDAMQIYDQSRLLWDGIERNDPEAQAEVDAIGLRMQEAWQMCEDAFAEQAEYWMYHVKEDPWSLINDPALTADQQEAVLYYINSKAAMDGVMDAANESADRKRAEVETAVSRRTHHDSKTIIPATMKVDDRKVYIVKGNVVMHPDGSAVDVRNSDNSIVVCDAESGEYSFTSPDQIFKVDEPISPEDELNTAYAGIQAEQEAILDTSVDTEDAPADEAPEEPSAPIADTKEYDKGYEDGIEVSKDLSNEVLDSTIEDLRSREFLSDEWRGRLEAYEYEQQRRAMEGQNVPTNSVPNSGESVLNPTENAVSEGEIVPEAVSNVENGQQTALSRIPTNEEGEPMFESVDRETALDGLVEATGGNVENATSIALAQVQQLSADLEALKKKPPTKKAPKLKGSPMAMAKAQRDADEAYATAVEEYNNLLASTKQRLDAWTGISSLFTSRKAEARAKREAEMAAQNAKAHDEAVARFEEEQRIKAEKQAEQDAIGTHAVNPKITEKWNASPKVEGNPNAITLPDGSTIRGRYYPTEAGAASASHDANNGFIPTEGFPIDKHGLSVNDRDYQRDNDAQAIVRQIADSYDNRALQSPVIVSKDGVVLSGNNRTMSGDLAAHQGTDKAYVDYLREFGQMYGFTPEQIDGMTHPRVVFVPDEAMPYDASTFSRFNAQEMKSQSKPEAAVKLGKIVPDNVFGSIVRDISRYDRMSDYYADEKAVAHALGSLMQAGVINDKQMPELRTGTALSAAGKELIENTLIGKVFQATPDAVRQIISVPTMRQSIVMGLSEIANNRTLSDADYDIAQELGKAVDLVNRARAAQPDVYTDGMPVSPFGRMQGLFDDEFGDSRVTDATTLLLADIFNSGKPSDLRKVLATYNSNAQQSANGQADIFTGTIPTKEEILTTVIDHFRNATPKEQQALVDAAIAERKRRAEVEAEQRGRDQASEQTPNNAERGAEPQQPTAGADNELPPEEQALAARVEITDNDWAEGDSDLPTYKRDIIIDGTHKVTQIDAPNEDGHYTGTYFEFDGKRFGDISEIAQYIDGGMKSEPTEAQKKAGNYKMEHRRVDGHNISIENPKGSVRRGIDPDGKPWETTMQNDYGYIRGTEGVDGDHIDVFLSETPEDGDVFVVDQVNPASGEFDEHKVMYGFPSEQAARRAYLANYEEGWQGLGAITHVSKEEFKKWIQSSKRKTKPFADYASVKPIRYDNQGNPIDENGNLIIEDVESIDEITDKDFTEPTRTVGLPKIPQNVDEAIGANGRKAIIKKSIFVKNRDTHGELTPNDSRDILNRALYNPNLVGTNQPIRRPDYKVAIQTGDKNAVVVLDVYAGKDNVEIVGWRKVDAKGLAKMKRQAEREGGQFLILSPNEGSAAALSALPSDVSSDGKDNTLSSDKQENGAESSEPYAITPATYTNKKGKTSDVSLLTFNRELSDTESRAVNDYAREKLSEGRFAKTRGWKDRESGGWMFRTEEDARKAAELISDTEAVADRQPLTAQELREAVEPVKKPAKPKKAPINRVSLDDVMTDLSSKGEAKLSDHAEPVKTEPEVEHEISDDEMKSLADELRDLLGIGEDEGDADIKFRDPGELSPAERQKVQAAGIRLAMGLIERGTTAFPDYAGKMVRMLGDKIRPWLKSFYEGARWTPGYEGYAFTPTEEVAKFDVQNFDKKQADPIKQAEMIVEERKAQDVATQASKELTEIRNQNRKKEDEQITADTAALAGEAEAVAGEAENHASLAGGRQPERKTILRDLKRIDDTLDKVNDQLALLGYYEADEVEKDFNEAYGYMRNAEKKAVSNAVELTKQLVKDLGIDLKVTSSTTAKRGKKPTVVSANVAPAGGGVTVAIPLTEERELKIYITLEPADREEGEAHNRLYYRDDLFVNGIMYRVENPNGKGYDRYGSNQWLNPKATYAEMLRAIKRDVYRYLPEQTPQEGVYKSGESVQYSADGGHSWTDAKVVEVDADGIKLDTGLAPVLYVNATTEQVRRKPAEQQMQELADMAERGESPYIVTPEVEAQLAEQRKEQENEDIFQKAERIAKETQEKKKKSVSSQKKSKVKPEQPIGDLFGGLFDEAIDNDKQERTDLGTRAGEAGGQRQQRKQDTQVGGNESRREIERPARASGNRGTGVDTDADRLGGRRVSRVAEDATLSPISDSERKNVHNNFVERGTDTAPKSVDARIKANIEAIETLKRLRTTGDDASEEDMKKLRAFSGWGGLGKAFSDWTTQRKLKELIGEKQFDEDAQLSRNSAYFTPAYVVDAMWDIARAMGFKGGKILEGSAGVGNVLGLMPRDFSERSSIHAVEKDTTTGGMLALLYPDADIDVKGFEETKIENGSVDLAITNVPFVPGLHVKDSTGDRDLSNRFKDIHNFCIAKNVRKLRDGGIGIFITTAGTLDSTGKLYKWLTSEGNSDIVGLFRMHNETFGGTNATSDIIVVRKRIGGVKSPYAIDASHTTGVRVAEYDTGETKTKKIDGVRVTVPVINTLSMSYNRYFVEHPEHMAGEMKFGFEAGDTYRPKGKSLYPTKEKDQGKMLKAWVSEMQDKIFEQTEEQPTTNYREAYVPTYDKVGNEVKTGTIVIDSNGRICVNYDGQARPLMSDFNAKNPKDELDRITQFNKNKVKGRTRAQVVSDYNAIKKALSDVLEYEKSNDDDSELQQHLDALNKSFDNFVALYGHLHGNNGLAWLKNDVDYPSILALETYREEGLEHRKVFGKADIFSRRVVTRVEQPKPTNVKDGVILSIRQHGKLDIGYIASELGTSEDKVKKQIVEAGLGFENPLTHAMEASHEYLSGNVREKLRQAEENNEDGQYTPNIAALRKVVPHDIPSHFIEFSIGSSWIRPEIYEEYIKERTGAKVKLTYAVGMWTMEKPKRWNITEQDKSFGVKSEICNKIIPGHALMEAAMTNKTIRVSTTIKGSDGDETINDPAATSACATKVDEIRDDFKSWLRARMDAEPELAKEIEERYNGIFNNSAPMIIPDEYIPEYFDGASRVIGGKPIKLRSHQAKAVVRGTMQSLMLAHEVGTGKTFTLITTAMEMRRLGAAKKPMIVVQNATLGQFVASAKALYPDARILSLEDRDRNAQGRKDFYAKIRYNDWDMVVIPQSVLEKIPDHPDRERQFIEESIEEKMEVIEAMESDRENSRLVADLKKDVEKMRDRLATLDNETWEDKTLSGSKKKDGKKTAVTRENARTKAEEMLDRATDDTLNFDDLGVDAILVDEAHEYKHLGFATAMQRGIKGVDPSYSKKCQGLFLKVKAVQEMNAGRNVIFATGTPISNTAAEIWTFMRYLLPRETMEQHNIWHFDDFVRNFGSIQQMLEFTTAGKYKENNRFAGYTNLPELARIWAGIADTVLTAEAGEVKSQIPELEGGKPTDIYLPQTAGLRAVIKYVKKELEAFEQMSGQEKKENSHIPLTMYGIAKAAAIDARLVMPNAPDDPHSKTNECVRQTLRSLKDSQNYNGTVAIFADNYQRKNKQTGEIEFNLFEDIRDKLIASGVPAEQIMVMRDGLTDKKKEQIFAKVNAGEIRVILGTTPRLGVGVNIQERLHTLMHIDAPNRPMDYWQRMGRLLRQGNLHKEMGIPVRVIRFGVEDSLDVTAYQRLKTKGAIADAVMNSKALLANNLENRVLEEEGDEFGNITAELSGSEYAILQNQTEKELRKLIAKQDQHRQHQMYIHRTEPRLRGQIQSAEERIARNDEALERLSKADGNIIEMNGKKYQSRDDMEEVFKAHNKSIAERRMKAEQGETTTSVLRFSIGGIPFELHSTVGPEVDWDGNARIMTSSVEQKITCPELFDEAVDVKSANLKKVISYLMEEIISGKEFKENREYAINAKERYEADLSTLLKDKGKEFEHGDRIKELQEKLVEYTEALQKDLAEKEAKYAEMDAETDEADGIVFTREDDEEDDSSSKSDNAKFRLVEEGRMLDALNAEETETGFRYAQMVTDDVFPGVRPPMTGKVDGEWRAPMEFGEWEQSEEGMRKANGKADLVQGNGRTTGNVAYNPYFHVRVHPLNDQFSAAFNRPELIVVRGEYPKSELTSGYRAEGAKNAVGMTDWHAGSVNGQLPEDKKVQTMLSRYFRPQEIVPWSEVADRIMSLIEGEDITFPVNVVPPMLRAELAKRGAKFQGWSGSVSEEDKPRIAEIERQLAEGNYYYDTEGSMTDADIAEHNASIRRKIASKRNTDPEAMTERVSELSNKFGVPVRIVSSKSEAKNLPTVRKRNAKGWFDPETGEVVVVIPNNANVADVENTMAHEVIGHKGLRAFIGEENFDHFMGEIYNNASERIRSIIDRDTQKLVDNETDRLREKMRKEHEAKGEDAEAFYYTDMAEARVKAEEKREQFRRDATEEYMSDLGGRIGDEGFERMKQDELTLWGKIKRRVQRFLDRFLKGFKFAKSMNLTDKDLAYILYRTWDFMQGKSDVFRRAEDAARRNRAKYDAEDSVKFRDGGMSLEETITKMKTEAMQANTDNLQAKRDAMKAIGGNLNHLRQAMARQREYDITTVKSVTDLAKILMNNGLLDDMSKYETQRILSAVKNVVGRQDVSGYVQKVMDIMVGNQLRNAFNQFGRLLTIKGSRVDARGIEVQGELDPEGAAVAKVLKRAMNLPKDDIDNRIAEALNRMGSADTAIADEAAIEYAGLQLARQYVEDIAESKAEEKGLRDSIRQAKEDKDAGQMTDTAYRQYVESTEDAIRQNRVERAEAYYSLVEQVGDVMGQSIERAKAWREAEKQRVEEIHHNANSDMEGRPTDEHHKEDRVQKIANNSGIRFLLAPLGTFDQMLRMFGRKNVRGEGYLWNRFMRGWVDATEREYTKYQDALKVLDAKVSEVFGKKMKWSDLFSLERKLPKANVRFWDGGEMKDHEIMQGNLLYIYMADKMTDGRMKLRRMGITEDDIEAIKASIDPRFIELADWMQDEFLVGKRNEYNEVHKRMFGASMAAIDNYFPLKVLANARVEDVDVADDTTDTALPATSTGSIIKRRRNNLALDVVGADAFSVILDHLQQMERWAAFAEFNRDLNTLLSYKRFRNQVMNMSSVYGGGKTLWNNFRNVCSMAAGAYRPPIAALDKAAVNIAKGITAAKVSFRVFTALKQFLSMPAYASDSNPLYLAENIINPFGAWKWSMENLPLFHKRWNSRMAGDPRLMKSDMDWKAWRSNIVQLASRIGMSPNAFVDALTVAIGSHSMYQTKKAKYLRYGYEEDVAERRAKQDATILFNQTQQSSESAFLSTMQVDRSWLSVLFTIFRNSSMSYTRQLYDAVRNLAHRGVPGYKQLTEEFMAKQMRRDGIDPDQADRNAKREYRRSILRDIAKMGIFGFALQLAWNLGAYLPYLFLGDDKEEKSKMWDDVWNHTMFGSIEGLTGGDVMSSAGQMWMNGEGNWDYLVKDMPLASDLSNILRKMPKDQVAAMNDVVNLLVQSGVGVNPQSLTDAVVAIMDVCGDDAQTSRECALLMARILNCPQSQIDKIYFDELDATAAEASQMTPSEIAERYARYKVRRGAPLTGWAYGSEQREQVMQKYRDKSNDLAKERLTRTTDAKTPTFAEWRDEYNATKKRVSEIGKLKDKDEDAYYDVLDELELTPEYERYQIFKDYKRDVDALTKEWLRAATPEQRDSCVRAIVDLKAEMVEEMRKAQ